VIDKINKSRGEKIKSSRVEGIDELEGMVRGQSRQIQNVLSLGGTRQTIIQKSGQTISTGATTINFLNGTIAVPTGNDGTTINYTAPSGAGGSGYQQPLSGGLSGTNTWATAPNALSIDGVVKQQTQVDGTVNWTGTTTTVLTGAQLPNFDIFAVA
jgi:hypothetical protein